MLLTFFMAKSEVRGTGSDGRALMQYQAAVAGVSKVVNMVHRFSL